MKQSLILIDMTQFYEITNKFDTINDFTGKIIISDLDVEQIHEFEAKPDFKYCDDDFPPNLASKAICYILDLPQSMEVIKMVKDKFDKELGTPGIKRILKAEYFMVWCRRNNIKSEDLMSSMIDEYLEDITIIPVV